MSSGPKGYEEWEFYNSNNYDAEMSDADTAAFSGWELEASTVTASASDKMGGISNEAIAAIEAHNRVEYDQTASLDLTRRRISETKELQDEKDAEEAKELSQFSEEAEELGTQIRSTRKGNETFGTKVESVNLSNATYENLAKVLRELAKNGKINYSWTVDDWKCSPREIGLATASAKVFQELITNKSFSKMAELCKSYEWKALTTQEAEQRKAELWINSNPKDIKSFYSSYKEYQNANTSYKHLQRFMWFIFEKWIETVDDLTQALSIQSKKITNTEISKMGDRLFRRISGRDTYYDVYTGQEVDHRPSDWKQKTRFQIVEQRLKDADDILPSDKMLALLSDLNFDWEINWWDVWYKTWSQLSDAFRRTVATVKLENPEFDNNKAIQNLLAYAKKSGINVPEVTTVEGLYEWMTKFPEGYSNTVSLQNLLKNLPIELWDVLKNWEKAGPESLASIIAAAGVEMWIEKQAAEEATKKVETALETEENKKALEEAFPDEDDRRNVTQQLLSQLPWVLLEQAINQQWGLGIWHEIPLDQIIKWSSIWFNIWVDGQGKPSFGLFAWWDRKWQAWKQDFSVAVDAWANYKIQDFTDFKWLFIPLATISAATGRDINEGQRNATLDAKWLHRVELWWNIWVVAISWIPQLMYGAHVWYESNKQRGIESQAKNMRTVIWRQAEQWLQLLNGEGVTDKKAYLKTLLRQEYKKSSEESLNTATDSLYSIISQFKIDDKTTEDDINIYSRVIADVFTDQWRDNAIIWIADNRMGITGWKVWIEMFNNIPTLAAVIKATRYYNARTVESDNSVIRRIDALNLWTWNSANILWEAKELWQTQVAQINEVLKTYWAKDGALRYVEWEDGKPGRVEISTSLVKWMWINVRVSQSLKWYVNEWMTEKRLDWDTYYLFPANTVYRLFQETWWDLKSATLNIGSDKNNDDDISLSDVEGMRSLIWNEELMWAKRWEFVEWSEYTAVESWLDYKAHIDELFTPEVVDWLKTIDSKNRRRFNQFMKNKRDANADLQQTIDALVACLTDKKFDAIKNMLQSKTFDVDKQLIVDRVLAISADANVHNESWLNINLKERWDFYKKDKMVWPNGRPIFSEINVNRDALVSEIKAWGNLNPELQTNLLWATAFYNKNNTSKGLALTWLWVTTVLWWKMSEISWEDRTKVENWFLWEWEWDSRLPWSLEEGKSPVEWKNLKNWVSSYVRDQIWEFKTDAWESMLTDAQVKSLLKWKEVELNLDNSQEIVKVKLDVKYMFYLMWECANESVGMQLGKLSVLRQTEVQDYKAWALILNDTESANRVAVSRKDYNIGFAVWLGWKKEDESELGTTTPETTEVPNSTPTNPGNPIDPNNPETPTPPEPEQPPVAPENPGGWNENQWGGRRGGK